jgi:hypothetical protein
LISDLFGSDIDIDLDGQARQLVLCCVVKKCHVLPVSAIVEMVRFAALGGPMCEKGEVEILFDVVTFLTI